MNTEINASTVVEDALAALTPQQREAWRRQWEQAHWKSAPFETWLRYLFTVLAAAARRWLQRHGY